MADRVVVKNNLTEAIRAYQQEAFDLKVPLWFPNGEFPIEASKLATLPGITWDGEGNAHIVTKETSLYNVMLSINTPGVTFKNLIFDQTGDADLLPTKPLGCHILHAPVANGLKLLNCSFYGYGNTSVFIQPADGNGDTVLVEGCKAYWKRKVNTYYDVSVFNIEGMNLSILNNEVVALKGDGILDWKPQSGFEIQTPSGNIKGNLATDCNDGFLYLYWPLLYTVYDDAYPGVTTIDGNKTIRCVRGIHAYGSHLRPGINMKNVVFQNNDIDIRLAQKIKGYYYPTMGMGLQDGGVDAAFFRNIKFLNNNIGWSYDDGLDPRALLDYGPPAPQLGGISFMTNNSCEDIEVGGNMVNFPFATMQLRALRERGTNTHRRLSVHDNVYNDCAIYHGYREPGKEDPFDAVYNLENVDGAEFTGDIINGVPIKKWMIGQNCSNVTIK